MSVGFLVIMVIGVVVILAGIVLLTNIIDIVPEIDDETSAPPIFETLVIPEQGVAGTLFRVKTSIPTDQEYFMNAKVKGEDFALYDDGKHGDGDVGDGIYSGIWDSSGIEVGEIIGSLSVHGSNGADYSSSFVIEIVDSVCKPILVNGVPNDKVDIVVIGQDYGTLPDFDQKVDRYLDINGDGTGIFSYTPFKEEISRFNLYSINQLLTEDDLECEVGCKGVASLVCCNDKKISRIISDCPADEVIVLINSDEFCGSASNYAKVCTGIRGKPMVLVHEFGHTFGGLGDEYDYGVYENLPEIKDYNYPNCVKDCTSWPAGTEAGCFAICGYAEYFRSVESESIMYKYVHTFNPVSIYYINKLLDNYVSGKSSQELPAPAEVKTKKYNIELSFEDSKVEFDDVYVRPGDVPDYKIKGEDYLVSILSTIGEVLYSSSFEKPDIIYPFYEEGTDDRPTALYEPDIDYSLAAPYFDDAEKIEIRDSVTGRVVLESDLGHLSDNCGDSICDEYESNFDCSEDCEVLEDNYCSAIADNICDKDCSGKADPDCKGNLFWIIGVIAVILIIVIYIIVKKVRKPEYIDLSNNTSRYQQNLNR